MSVFIDDSDARYLPDEGVWVCSDCMNGSVEGNADDPCEYLAEQISDGEARRYHAVLRCDECGTALAHAG